ANDQRPEIDAGDAVGNEPLRAQRKGDDLVGKVRRELDRVAAGAITHRIEHDGARLPLDGAAQIIRLQVAKLAEKRAESPRRDQALGRLVVLLQIQLAAAQKNFAESCVGV